MNIQTTKNGTTLTLAVEGHIDVVTAPLLEKTLNEQWDGVTELVLDFSAVSFISSAGLRVLMWAYKQMNARQGKMVLRHVRDEVKEIFDLTGLSAYLNVS